MALDQLKELIAHVIYVVECGHEIEESDLKKMEKLLNELHIWPSYKGERGTQFEYMLDDIIIF